MKHTQHLSFVHSHKNRIKSLVCAQQLSRSSIEHLINLAEFIRSSGSDINIMKHLKTILATKSCILFFPQCSTRTFSSFSLAAQTLGMIVEEIRDPQFSAINKGESEIDCLIALGTLSDLIIIRHINTSFVYSVLDEFFSRGIETHIINAGNGSDQHPTQAMLDFYTISAHFDILTSNEELSVAFVGDLKRSRAVRSLSYILSLYPQITQIFVAPSELQIEHDILTHLKENSIQTFCTDSLDTVLSEADVFYMGRIQDEYGETSQEIRQEYCKYHLTTDKVNLMKPKACILHGLPRRTELPAEIDRDLRAKYWEAVSRGKQIRIALLLYLFGYDDIRQLQQCVP